MNKQSAMIGKIISQPLRLYILQQLGDAADNGEAGRSPRMIASTLSRSLPTVSYHMRMLLDKRAVRLVREIPRRGSIEHIYTLTQFGFDVLDIVERIDDVQ